MTSDANVASFPSVPPPSSSGDEHLLPIFILVPYLADWGDCGPEESGSPQAGGWDPQPSPAGDQGFAGD